MLTLAVDLATFGLLVAMLVHAAFLHLRLTRLRRALAEASALLPVLDAATTRLAAATEGVSNQVQTGLETIETRLTGGRAVAAELGAAIRMAQNVLRRLEQHRIRPAPAIPREMAEPKGLEEIAARRATRQAPEESLALEESAVAEAPAAEKSAATESDPELQVA